MADEQMSFASVRFERYAKTTKRAAFLAEMNRIVPWGRLCEIVAPHYPKGDAGRPPIPLERMLRVYFLQQWFTLSDPGAEEALYDSVSMREFVGVDLGNEPPPDETTICKFRHLLERHELGVKIFDEVKRYLSDCGVKIAGGTIVDATIIHAPSSTKNKTGERDPEMHSTKKGNQWYFGMKAHIGVDSRSKIVHTVVTTAANTHDGTVLPDLLHGEETCVWGDAAYVGKTDVIRKRSPRARALINKRGCRNRPLTESDKAVNRWKSSVRSRVEHLFGIVKGMFGFRKTRYRGLAKNDNRLHVLFALANIVVQKRRLLRLAGA
jgi:transposase, IS5 family